MNNKGQALIVVVTFLVMLFIIGVAFYALSQAERTSSLRHLDSLRARYIAEAGVVYAQKVLNIDREANLIDSLEDVTFKHFQGEDVDWDGDGEPERRAFEIMDSQGNLFGRFSVKIADEAAKIHLNVTDAGALEGLFAQLGIDNSKAGALLSRRPFNAIEQIGPVFTREEFNLVKDFLTVYSRDAEIDLERNRRAYLNSSSVQVILEALLSRGVKDAYQKAANLKDAADIDLAQTVLDKYSLKDIAPSGLVEAGSWEKSGNYYEAPAGGSPGRFIWSNLPVEDGEYFCFLSGPLDKDVVGEVYLDAEDPGQPVISGEGLVEKVKVEGGGFGLYIKPGKTLSGRLSRIELVSPDAKDGLERRIITGTEALVINELWVRPRREINISAVEILPGERFHYDFTQLKPGDYYLIVKAAAVGNLVGDVSINARNATNLYHGDYFPDSVNVGADGSLAVEIKNNSLSETSFAGITILQEPDAEFIELLNLSSDDCDLSKFSLEVYSPTGELIPGWPGRIPDGTKIGAYQHLVFSVDNGDASPSPLQLRNNNISFRKLWGFNAVGLIFDDYTDSIDKTFDLLPDNGGRIILKNASGDRIDAVEYSGSGVADFVSLERPDPTNKTDADNDGLFDGWYLSQEEEKQATPALANENLGMYTQDPNTGEWTVKHNPGEIKIFNRKISDLAEVQQLSSGRNWEKFGLLDLARMSDCFAAEALEFALSGHYKSGEFQEQAGGIFESLHKEDTGIWEFLKVPAGSYLLSITSGEENFSTGNIRAAVKTSGQEDFSPEALLLFKQAAAAYGIVELTKDLSGFQLKIINDVEGRLTLKEIQLEPVSYLSGRININTADAKVLQSVLSGALAQTIIDNRPLGAKDGRNLGVAELFLLDTGFLSFANALTVKSDIYRIDSRGEYIPPSKILTYQIIYSVVERGK